MKPTRLFGTARKVLQFNFHELLHSLKAIEVGDFVFVKISMTYVAVPVDNVEIMFSEESDIGFRVRP